MDYQVSVADGGRYILIRVFVPMTSAIGVRCGVDASRLGVEKKMNSYLFDLRDSPNAQSVVDNYEFAHGEIADFGFPKSSRSAFLVRSDDRSHDFINTAFFNAGYITKLFTDETSAVSWLDKEPPPLGKEPNWHDHFP